MVCNTGVGLTSTIDGVVHHFESRGLYDGVSVLRDDETGTLWHHLTGEAMAGPLRGRRLDVFNLLHTTVARALEIDPDMEIAISERPYRRRNRWAPWAERVPGLSRLFRRTIDREDDRLPTMDVGLGLWTDRVQRYYSMNDIQAAGGVVVDRLADRPVVVYYDPAIHSLAAVYAEAAGARWEDDAIRLDSGDRIRAGVLHAADGGTRPLERPLQVFTRWYGFALTFPETGIFGQPDR